MQHILLKLPLPHFSVMCLSVIILKYSSFNYFIFLDFCNQYQFRKYSQLIMTPFVSLQIYLCAPPKKNNIANGAYKLGFFFFFHIKISIDFCDYEDITSCVVGGLCHTHLNNILHFQWFVYSMYKINNYCCLPIHYNILQVSN